MAKAKAITTDNGVVARKLGRLYLGGASFSAYDPEKRTSKANSSPKTFITIETGFDCWANVSTLHGSTESNEVIGVIVTTYGQWSVSKEGKRLVKALDSAKVGDEVDLTSVLSLAPQAQVAPCMDEDQEMDECRDFVTTKQGLALESGSFPDGYDKDEDPLDREDLMFCELNGKISGFAITPFFLSGIPADESDESDEYEDDDDGYEDDDEGDVCVEGPVVLVNPAGQKLLGISKRR